MLSDRIVDIADRYWASYLGVTPESLFAKPLAWMEHGGEMAGYRGVFALFRNDQAMVSVPLGRGDEIRRLMPAGECSPLALALALVPMASAMVGPAFIGYTESVEQTGVEHTVRSLEATDARALESLKEDCEAKEWEHGGSAIGNPCSGVFEEGRLVAVAGYEVWGGEIAHLSAVTHPDFRELGFGRSAVAHVAQRALEAGLLPQYRTLEGNRPSLRIAETLGFERYATSMAVRFKA